jgi:hypothetical protein
MVLVIENHAYRPFQVIPGKSGVMAQSAHNAVGFQVRLADQEYAKFITKIVPVGTVRVMAGTYGINIHQLHLAYFFPHVLNGNRPAYAPGMFVTVYPLDDKPCSVEVKHPIPDLQDFKTYPAALIIQNPAVRPDKDNHRSV